MALSYASIGLGHSSVVATGPVFTSATMTGRSPWIVTVGFSNIVGGISMSGAAQCHEAATPRGHNTSTAACCSAVPRGTVKGNASLTSDGGVPFELLNSHTGQYVLAAKTTVSADGKSVALEAPAGVMPIGVRYCEQGYPLCVLRNGAGLPAMPFLANVTAA